jgi:hypothetical protein
VPWASRSESFDFHGAACLYELGFGAFILDWCDGKRGLSPIIPYYFDAQKNHLN